MALYTYKTSGTCSKEIHFEVEDGIIKSVKFLGGCPGNTLGLSNLLKDMKIEDAISRLEGIRCGFRPTSCPNELAIGLREYLKK